jgi:hypothetical protein
LQDVGELVALQVRLGVTGATPEVGLAEIVTTGIEPEFFGSEQKTVVLPFPQDQLYCVEVSPVVPVLVPDEQA